MLLTETPHNNIDGFEQVSDHEVSIFLLKVNNRNSRTMREICLNLTIKAPFVCMVKDYYPLPQ